MSERLGAPQYIDPNNPDYAELSARLRDRLERAPRAEDFVGLKGDALIVTVMDWAKQDIDNHPSPHLLVIDIFGPSVFEGKDWGYDVT